MMKKRGKRIKTGPHSYINLNSKGQVTSSTFKYGKVTKTNFSSGGSRTSINLGGGYSEVSESGRKRSAYRPPRQPERAKSSGPDFVDELFDKIESVFSRLSRWVEDRLK